MINVTNIHHVAIICIDYAASKHFYTHILGCTIIAENYREARDSYKLDLAVNGTYAIELFSFPDPAKRPSRPEGTGLRHLAFQVPDIDATIAWLTQNQIVAEPVRMDEFTGSRFTFIADPDDLPIEFYEIQPL